VRQEYRDRMGKLLGWRIQLGRRILGHIHTGAQVGWYDTVMNETRDQAGRLVGRGDMLAALIVTMR